MGGIRKASLSNQECVGNRYRRRFLASGTFERDCDPLPDTDAHGR